MAAVLVLRLIRITGWRFAWSLVSAALILMSLQRSISLYRALFGEGIPSSDLWTGLVALIVSVLMITGIAVIGTMSGRAKRVERELRRREAEVRRLNEELMSQAEERMTEVDATRDALTQIQSLAAFGEMTGSVAHDLRNPLGTIAISFDVIQYKCEAANLDLDRVLSRARRNIRRCDNLIRGYLDFTNSGGLHPESTVLDVWLSEILEERFVPSCITINRDLGAGGATVAFDREQIRRAVINLVENACQAMVIDETGDGVMSRKELTVATRRLNGRIEIEVSDTGPGIPEGDLSKVLEPLFSTKSAGTGLGLPIVQRIMARHGGGFDIASEKQRGTQARLWLPVEPGVEQGIRECA
jgi:signal transduction histidine kinase